MYSSFCQDVWDAKAAASIIADEAVTWTMGSTPFLYDLTNTPIVKEKPEMVRG